MPGQHHHRYQQGRQCRRIGHGRTGERRQQAGRDDRHVTETAALVPHQRHGNVDDAFGQATDIHDLAGQHEERHGHQWEAVRPVEQVLGNDLRVEQIQVEHQRHTDHQQGKRDGHAQCHAAHQGTEENNQRHGRVLLMWSGVMELGVITSASLSLTITNSSSPSLPDSAR